MALPRFTGEISAGHISIIVSIVGAAVGFYSYVTGALSNHEYRIAQIERRIEEGQKERMAFQAEMRAIAQQIREDIAAMKVVVKHLEGR